MADNVDVEGDEHDGVRAGISERAKLCGNGIWMVGHCFQTLGCIGIGGTEFRAITTVERGEDCQSVCGTVASTAHAVFDSGSGRSHLGWTLTLGENRSTGDSAREHERPGPENSGRHQRRLPRREDQPHIRARHSGR